MWEEAQEDARRQSCYGEGKQRGEGWRLQIGEAAKGREEGIARRKGDLVEDVAALGGLISDRKVEDTAPPQLRRDCTEGFLCPQPVLQAADVGRSLVML